MRHIGATTLLTVAAACSPERGIMPVETLRMTVAPQTVRCWGLFAQMDCLAVSIPSRPTQTVWSAPIDGFTFEPGFVYEIVIEGMPTGEEPRYDGPSHVYRLKRVIHKLPASAGVPSP